MSGDMKAAALWQHPSEIPILAAFLPAAYLKYGSKINALAEEYSDIYDPYYINYDFSKDTYQRHHVGRYTDDWGCVWHNSRDGYDSYVQGHPIPCREDILTYEAPILDNGAVPHGFLYLRYLDLRGFEEAMIDFAEEAPETDILLDKITTAECRQMEWLVRNTDPGVMITVGDDLGMQDGLAIGPERWRRYMKPRFTRLYQIIRKSGRYIYMHTDGQIYEIIPDLFDAGVNIVNPQFRANGLQNLERVCKGRYPICLDLDRQLFPFATPAELKDHVEEAITTMYLPEGGLGINIEFDDGVPLENMRAVLDTLRRMRHYKG